MRNKKAFTLVELLGVIVVLAILALITIPIISNVITDIRIKALKDSAYGLVEASNLYYVSKEVNSNIRFDKNESKDTLKELSYKGVVKEGTVIISKKGQVTVCVTDGKNSAYKNSNEKKVTTVKGKCEISEGSSIVYLDDEATIDSYDNPKLTELVNSMQEEINTLKSDNSSLNQQITNLSSRISETNSSIISLNDVYPVGSIYISTTEDTVAKVQSKFGGTWVAYGAGRTLVGVDTNQEEFDSIEETGGEKTHTLTIDEMPAHTHPLIYILVTNGNGSRGVNDDVGVTENTTTNGYQTKQTGGSQPHNNLQPYITVYMYKRTA